MRLRMRVDELRDCLFRPHFVAHILVPILMHSHISAHFQQQPHLYRQWPPEPPRVYPPLTRQYFLGTTAWPAHLWTTASSIP